MGIGWVGPENPNIATEKDLENCGANQVIRKAQPDIVILLADVWMGDIYTKIPTRDSYKLIWDFPLDGIPVPNSWMRIIRDADARVVMTKFAENAIKEKDPNINIFRIPRGIDLGLWNKLPYPKNEIKKEVFPDSIDKFVVGFVSRFHERKRIGRALEGFKKFIERGNHKDCIFYIHADVNDAYARQHHKFLVGSDGLINQLGLRGYVGYNPELNFEKGIPTDQLIKLYNTFDVLVQSSEGEGWCLPLIEAMSVGIPCIATDYTSSRELLEGHGKLAKVKTFHNGIYNIKRALVDTDDIANHLEYYYSNPERRMEDGQKAQKFVRQFDWSRSIRHWIGLIDRTLERKKVSKEKIELPKKKSINVCGAVFENTGFSIVTRNLAKALDKKTDVSIIEGGGRLVGFQVDEDTERILSKPQQKGLDIINHMPENQQELLEKSNACYKVSYFPWEINKWDSGWVYNINRFSDGYWCNSEFEKKIAIDNGVDPEIVRVIPNGTTVNPDCEPMKLSKKSYHFLALGNLGDIRKNTKKLIKAYISTFTGDDDVCLVLKSQPGHANSDPTSLVKDEMMGRKNPPAFLVIHKDLPDLSPLYKACDCLVHISHAEGFGQTLLDALKFGMPIIAPLYGGYVDFALPHIKPVKHYEIDATLFPKYISRSTWIDVDFDDLCRNLKECYKDKTSRKDIDLVPNYTWERSADKVMEGYENIISRPSKIKCYFETGIHSLWNKTNEYEIKKYAPNRIQFTKDFSEADFQIINITRKADEEFIYCNKYIANVHCLGEISEEPIEDYKDIFDNALMIYSHMNLKLNNFVRGPWGVNPHNFFIVPGIQKRYQILATGAVPQTEGITEIIQACNDLKKPALHIGPNLKYNSQFYKNAQNLSTKDMTLAYNQCLYTSGLRRVSGFELPVIEGILAGSRPICFNTHLYKYWYGDLVEYVNEKEPNIVVEQLKKIFNGKYRRVTKEEQQRVIDKFSWKVVAQEYWKNVMERL